MRSGAPQADRSLAPGVQRKGANRRPRDADRQRGPDPHVAIGDAADAFAERVAPERAHLHAGAKRKIDRAGCQAGSPCPAAPRGARAAGPHPVAAGVDATERVGRARARVAVAVAGSWRARARSPAPVAATARAPSRARSSKRQVLARAKRPRPTHHRSRHRRREQLCRDRPQRAIGIVEVSVRERGADGGRQAPEDRASLHPALGHLQVPGVAVTPPAIAQGRIELQVRNLAPASDHAPGADARTGCVFPGAERSPRECPFSRDGRCRGRPRTRPRRSP